MLSLEELEEMTLQVWPCLSGTSRVSPPPCLFFVTMTRRFSQKSLHLLQSGQRSGMVPELALLFNAFSFLMGLCSTPVLNGPV